MKDTKLLPDDPKLTAYALGELQGDERAAVEAALRDDPGLRAVVEEVRAAGLQLEAAFAAEPFIPPQPAAASPRRQPLPPIAHLNGHAPVNGSAGRGPVVATSGKATRAEGEPEYGRRAQRSSKWIKFPQFYFIVSGLAAACFAIIIALYRDGYEAKQQLRIAQQKQRAEQIAAADRMSRTDTLQREVVLVQTAPPVAETPSASPRGTLVDTSSVLGLEPARRRALESAPTDDRASPSASAASGQVLMGPKAPVATASPSTVTSIDLLAGAVPTSPTVPAPNGPVGGSASPIVFSDSITRTNEVVQLNAFTVTETREGAATALASAATRVAALTPPQEFPASPPSPDFGRNTEAYAYAADNDFVGVDNHPLSTFSVDVDTASYSNVRRIIEHGTLPPRDAVRVEELLNYFPYRYPAPAAKSDTTPFAASLEVADAPWAPEHRLVRIGLKAREVATADRAPANLVFLIDVSGSMNQPNKLPLVKESMRLLIGKLRRDDRVAIVTYAGNSGLALPSTPVARSREILRALEELSPGGSTNGAMGIQLAYDIAKAHFVKEGVNRVILCTDGDFNVGVTSEGGLVRLIEEKARTGVFLTVLGFGMGNLKDATLEKLADKGNGHYGYIDTRREAEKLLVDQVSSTLVTVAKDVKIQVEFNPAKVARYRLIGYENRQLKKEDFNNDNVDAGEIGAGHSVTALYEIVPVGADAKFTKQAPPVDDLKYQARGAVSSRLEMPSPPAKRPAPSDELLTVKVRFKKPDAFFSQKVDFALKDAGLQFADASPDFRFAAAVAQFGMILRASPHKGSGTIGDVLAWAATASASPADDPGGYRGEFIDLVRKAQRMVH
jgi:Ca-activated chloride channel homolog